MRLVPGGHASQRLEQRLAAADGNPYLVAAATIAAGLYGIEHKLTLSEGISEMSMISKTIFRRKNGCPSPLKKAVNLFAESEEAKEYFGEKFVEHFATTRMWEVNEYESWLETQAGGDDSGEVTYWELSRYFELI